MLEVIKNRRSCRSFDKSKKVEQEKIEEIVHAGLLAPSGMNRQTSVVIAISDPETRDRLARLNKKIWKSDAPEEFDSFYGAPVILLVIAHKEGLSMHDGAATIENMLLEATNQGLSSCWIHRAKEEIESEEGKDIISFTGLNLDDYIGIGHVIIGYPLNPQISPKQIKDGRAFYK